MDFNQLIRKLEQKKSELVAFCDKRWPARVGEMAISHFKQNFRDAGWNDNGLTKWLMTKRQQMGGKGAYYDNTPLLSGRNNLYSGFTYKANPGQVTVSNDVEYARIHNEGGNVTHRITPRMRKYAWARFFEETGIKKGDSWEQRQQKEKNAGERSAMWKRLALTPKQSSTVHIPQRRFMGRTAELDKKIEEYTERDIKRIMNFE
jgi:phage gpG-like protein|nr:MAG TPA: tail morphogenesis protein [Caudoviricetes sp.]